MIIKAVARSGGQQLAAYLMQEHKADRDKAELVELRGFATTDLRTALLSAEYEAENTRCTKPLYHVSFTPDKGEHLTPEQWQDCIERLEHRLGLDDQARAVVIHEHQDEQHIHVVWSRIDREQNKARELVYDHEKCTETAREIERDYGLRQLAPSHERTQEPLTRAEYEEARRQGRDVDEVRDAKAAIREAWERSDNGASFDNALRDAGLILAIGDTARAPYVVVDEKGKVHGIARTVDEKSKAVHARLADLDRDLLPTAEQAKEYQQQREQARADREREEKHRAEVKALTAEIIRKAAELKAEKARQNPEHQTEQQRAQAEKEHGHDTPEPPQQAQENTPQQPQEKNTRPLSPPTIVDGQGRPLAAAYTFGPVTEREKWQILTEQAHAKRDAADQIRAAEALRSDDREDRQEAARYIEEAARAATRRDPSPDTKTRADEITQATKDGQQWQERHDIQRGEASQAARNATPPNIAPEKAKEPAPNVGRAAGRAAGAIGDSVLRLADGLLGGLAGPVTHEQIRQQAAGTQQRTAEQVREATQQFQKPLTPQEREAKAREFDRAAEAATRARDAYRQAHANARGEERSRTRRAEFRANMEAREAAQAAARLRETEQQREEREAKEREEREAERRSRERQRER